MQAGATIPPPAQASSANGTFIALKIGLGVTGLLVVIAAIAVAAILFRRVTADPHSDGEGSPKYWATNVRAHVFLLVAVLNKCVQFIVLLHSYNSSLVP